MAIKALKNKPGNVSIKNRINEASIYNNIRIMQVEEIEIRENKSQKISNEEFIRIGKKYLRLEDLNDFDIQLIRSVFEHDNILACLPNNDKKFAFQVCAYILEGSCIVISQFLSVLKLQFNKLSDLNIPCCLVDSENTDISADCKFVFIYLNILKSVKVQEKFLGFSIKSKVSLIVLQEAQCIAKYTDKFRDNYNTISNFTLLFSSAKFLCTSTPLVESEKLIIKIILEKEFFVPEFPPLIPEVIFKVQKYENYEGIAKLIHENYSKKKGIIIFPSLKNIKILCDFLNKRERISGFISGKMPQELKNNCIEAWKNGNLPILIVASMFNLDFFIENSQFFIHIGIPKNIQECVTEIAYCRKYSEVFEYLILYSTNDFIISSSFKDAEIPAILNPELEEFYHSIEFIENSACCRKVSIFKYFGNHIEPCSKWCDHCLKINQGNFFIFEKDFTFQAKQILKNLADNTGYELRKIISMIEEKNIIRSDYTQILLVQMLLKRILYKKNNRKENSLIYKNIEFNFFDITEDIDDDSQNNFEIKLNFLEEKVCIDIDSELKGQLNERLLNKLLEENSSKSLNFNRDQLEEMASTGLSGDIHLAQIINEFNSEVIREQKNNPVSPLFTNNSS